MRRFLFLTVAVAMAVGCEKGAPNALPGDASAPQDAVFSDSGGDAVPGQLGGPVRADLERQARVHGIVLDGRSGQALSGAAISTTDGQQATTLAGGAFLIEVPSGAVRLTATAPGFLSATREVGVGLGDIPVRFVLFPRGEARVATGAAETWVLGPASIQVPAGAWAQGTAVVVTHLERARSAAALELPQFVDVNYVPRRVLSTFILEGSALQVPVTAVVPVPADATVDAVSLFRLDDAGNWSTPVAASRVAASQATFSIAATGTHAIAIDASRGDGAKVGYMVVDGNGSGITPGAIVPGGMTLGAADAMVSFVDPIGTRVDLEAGMAAELEAPGTGTDPVDADGGVPTNARAQTYLSPYHQLYGGAFRVSPVTGYRSAYPPGVRVYTPPPTRSAATPPLPPNVPRESYKPHSFRIRTRAAYIGVRGTHFSVRSCYDGPRTHETIAVATGVVEIEYSGGMSELPGGKALTLCAGCAQTEEPRCSEGGSASGPDTTAVVEPAVFASGQPNPVGIAGDGNSVYWTVASLQTGFGISGKETNGGAVRTIVSGRTDFMEGFAALDGFVYWSERRPGINRAGVSSGIVEELSPSTYVTGLGTHRVAVGHDRVYVLSSANAFSGPGGTTPDIADSNPAPSVVSLPAAGGRLAGVAVSLKGGGAYSAALGGSYLAWTENTIDGAWVRRISVPANTGLETLYGTSFAMENRNNNADTFTEVAADSTTIFWMDKVDSRIMSVPAAGGTSTLVASFDGVGGVPGAIAIDDRWVYWTVYNVPQPAGGLAPPAVLRAPRAGGRPQVIVRSSWGQDGAAGLVTRGGYLYIVARGGTDGRILRIPVM